MGNYFEDHFLYTILNSDSLTLLSAVYILDINFWIKPTEEFNQLFKNSLNIKIKHDYNISQIFCEKGQN